MRLISRAIVVLAVTSPVLAGGPHGEDEPANSCYATIGNNNPCSDYQNDDRNFLPYNVYYNGTMSFAFTPSTNASTASAGCTASNNTDSSAFMAIGDMMTPDKKTNRSNWDANPYWFQLAGCMDPNWHFWFNPNASDYKCSLTGSGTAGFMSSTSKLYWGQAWTLAATKNGDGFDLSGNLTTKKSNENNNVAYSFDNCIATGGRHYSYSVDAVYGEDQASMTGHISPTSAEMTITITNLTVIRTNFGQGCSMSWTFKGNAWSDGAKLITTDSVPQADGQSKLKVAKQNSGGNGNKPITWHWYYWAAVAVGVIIIVGWMVKSCLCGCCGFTRKNRRQGVPAGQPQVVYQPQPVQQQQGWYKGPQVYTQPQGVGA